MHLFGKKSISSVLYHLTLGIAIIMIVLSFLILYYLISGSHKVSGNGVTVLDIPFTGNAIKTKHSIYIVLVSFTFNTIYLWILSRLFRAFSKAQLFSTETIKRLRVFAYLNVLAPVITCLIAFLILKGLNLEFVIQSGLIFGVGLFCFIMLAIIKKGELIQSENDLTI